MPLPLAFVMDRLREHLLAHAAFSAQQQVGGAPGRLARRRHGIQQPGALSDDMAECIARMVARILSDDLPDTLELAKRIDDGHHATARVGDWYRGVE